VARRRRGARLALAVPAAGLLENGELGYPAAIVARDEVGRDARVREAHDHAHKDVPGAVRVRLQVHSRARGREAYRDGGDGLAVRGL
jgi:hypothetical protein